VHGRLSIAKGNWAKTISDFTVAIVQSGVLDRTSAAA